MKNIITDFKVFESTYNNMYFGKGYEQEAVAELQNALPGYTVRMLSKHQIGIFVKTPTYIDTYSGEHKNERLKAMMQSEKVVSVRWSNRIFESE